MILATLLPLISVATSIDSLPPKHILYASIDSFHMVQLQANIQAYQEGKKGQWMDYMPTLSLTYTANGKPRPNISYSFSQVRTSINRKKRNNNLLQQLIAQAEIDKKKDYLQVQKLLRTYKTYIQELRFMEEIHALDEQLFQYYKKAAQNGDIEPIEWVKQQKAHLQKKQQIYLQKQKIQLLIFDILQAAYL